MKPPQISVVIPVYNEEAVLPALIGRLYAVLDETGRAVRDHLRQRRQRRSAPRSSSPSSSTHAARRHPRRPLQRQLRPAHGDPRRLRARARRASRSRWTPTCRTRPRRSRASSPRCAPGHDYVGTYRRQRQDTFFRRAASRVINALRERTTHIHMTDQGCMLRAYDRALVDTLNACREVNTFIPALAYTFAATPTEIEVAHEPRHAGRVEVLALPADPPQLRPGDRLFDRAAAVVLADRHRALAAARGRCS